ncbi:MAG: PepSY-associated TM helix domain-containing protein, partial [Fimbriimonadaceae bacterium]
MYRFLRSLHKIAGLVGSLFLITISVTGFLLALKGQFTAIKPATSKGTALATPEEVIHPHVAMEAAYAQKLPGLSKLDDIYRLELHADKHVYKIVSKDNFQEVQVDAGTGKVISVGTRNDQLLENIHD